MGSYLKHVFCAGLCLWASALSAQVSDPTRPMSYSGPTALGYPQAGPTELVLSSIIRSPLRQVAVINGKTVQVGDSLGEYKVIQIVPDGVKMQSQTKVFVLELNPLQIKTAK